MDRSSAVLDRLRAARHRDNIFSRRIREGGSGVSSGKVLEDMNCSDLMLKGIPVGADWRFLEIMSSYKTFATRFIPWFVTCIYIAERQENPHHFFILQSSSLSLIG